MEQLRCVIEDVQRVAALYKTERQFLAAADRYLQLIETTEGIGLGKEELDEALAVLKVASIRQNGSWKSEFRWFDPAEEFRPQKRNRFEQAVIKALGTLETMCPTH